MHLLEQRMKWFQPSSDLHRYIPALRPSLKDDRSSNDQAVVVTSAYLLLRFAEISMKLCRYLGKDDLCVPKIRRSFSRRLVKTINKIITLLVLPHRRGGSIRLIVLKFVFIRHSSGLIPLPFALLINMLVKRYYCLYHVGTDKTKTLPHWSLLKSI